MNCICCLLSDLRIARKSINLYTKSRSHEFLLAPRSHPTSLHRTPYRRLGCGGKPAWLRFKLTYCVTPLPESALTPLSQHMRTPHSQCTPRAEKFDGDGDTRVWFVQVHVIVLVYRHGSTSVDLVIFDESTQTTDLVTGFCPYSPQSPRALK